MALPLMLECSVLGLLRYYGLTGYLSLDSHRAFRLMAASRAKAVTSLMLELAGLVDLGGAWSA